MALVRKETPSEGMARSHQAGEQGDGPLVDALPYIDEGYDEQVVRDAVFQLVDDELKRYRPNKNFLEHLPPLRLDRFETDMLKSEMERIANRKPLESMSTERYKMPSPSAMKMSDVAAWTESVNNSFAQLEHQAVRIDNLELLNEYGTETWKVYNSQLEKMISLATREANSLRQAIQEVNWQRKADQTRAREQLNALELHWISLVNKNYRIEESCVDLECQLANIRSEIAVTSTKKRRSESLESSTKLPVDSQTEPKESNQSSEEPVEKVAKLDPVPESPTEQVREGSSTSDPENDPTKEPESETT